MRACALSIGATAQPAARMSLPSLASLSLAKHAQHRKSAPRSARTGGLAFSREILKLESATRAASLLTLTNLTDRPERENTDQTEKEKSPMKPIKQSSIKLTDRPEDEQSSIILANLKHDRVAGCLLLQALLQSGFKPSLTVMQNMLAALDIPRPKAGENASSEKWMNAIRFFYCQMEGETDPLTRVYIAAKKGDVELMKKVINLHAKELDSYTYSRKFPEDPHYEEGIEQQFIPDLMTPYDAAMLFIGWKVQWYFKYLMYAFRIALSYGHFEMMDFLLETLIDRQIEFIPLRQGDSRENQIHFYTTPYEYECAARSQNVKVLEWLDEKSSLKLFGEEYDPYVAIGLAYNTDRAVAKWFLDKNVDFSQVKEDIFWSAMKARNLPLMEWLSNNYFPDGELVRMANFVWFQMAGKYGHDDVLLWLMAKKMDSNTNVDWRGDWLGALNGSAEFARPEALALAFEMLDSHSNNFTQNEVRGIVRSRKRQVQKFLDKTQALEVDYHSFLKRGERSKAEKIADAKKCLEWLEKQLNESSFFDRELGEEFEPESNDEDGVAQ